MFGLLLFLAVLSFLGLLALFVLRRVLKLCLWFIAVLFLGVGLLIPEEYIVSDGSFPYPILYREVYTVG